MPAAEPALKSLIEERLDPPGANRDAALAVFHDEIRRRYGTTLLGVLLYGSYLRGKRDAPPDLYVLVDCYKALPRWQAAAAVLLPPNVYHLKAPAGETTLRAKCATVSLTRFEAGLGRSFDSYFWARFAQPSRLLYARDAAVRERIIAAVADAVRSFAGRTAPLLGSHFSARELWAGGLAMTYRCELRSESAERSQALYTANSDYFEGVTAALRDEKTAISASAVGGDYAAACTPLARRLAPLRWGLRRLQGKLLSVARVCKGALTFDDPLDYLLWKIERHTGIREIPTDRQRRHPLLFAWPLLWRLYRRGAFR